MKKYIVGLASPSHRGLYEKDYYSKVYEIEATNEKELDFLIEEKLKRQFSLKFNIPLTDVMLMFRAIRK